jgi:AcrR family transcriptional regulator
VAEICRHAQLSNGVFYRYYRNKEQIFKQLLEEFLERFREDFNALAGRSISMRLKKFIEIVIGAGKKYRKMITVFREGQYRYPEFEKHLRNLYIDGLIQIYEREISESEYLYITSIIRFLSIRSIYNQLFIDFDEVQAMIEEGFFLVSVRKERKIFAPTPQPLVIRETDRTRDRLIRAGIELFGDKGFYNVDVYEIAKTAGFSVGTFYIHFTSKETFLREIVDLIGRQTRRFITNNLDISLNRLELELQGMYLFLLQFSKNQNYYEIVREAEFVINESVSEYYDRFERGYLKRLSDTKTYNPRMMANALMGISHYLGIETFFSPTIRDEKKIILELGKFLREGIKK